MNKLITFGEILWDILPSKTVLGGAPFNFTHRINSLGNQGLIVSRLGDDELGKKALDQVRKLQLSRDLIQIDSNYPTGTVEVSFDQEMNPDYVIIPEVAYDQIEFNEQIEKNLEDADCVYFGTLAQRSEKSHATLKSILQKTSHCKKFLDINLRKKCYSKESIDFSFQYADILKLNEDEVVEISRMFGFDQDNLLSFAQMIMNDWNISFCILTLGDQGAFCYASTGESVYSPGYKITLQDSLGAGDAFSAGFLHQFLNGASLLEACEFGNVLGAITATQEGATGVITQEHIDEFKAKKIERSEYDFD